MREKSSQSLPKKNSSNIGTPLVSVIMLNFNGKHFLDRCLKSISTQSYSNYEIIFVDNNSTDNSVEFVEQHFPHVIIVRNDRNVGFAEGNNIGFRHARGEYFIALNTDTEVKENFIEELVKVAQNDEKIGSVGCKVVRGDGLVWDGPVFTNRGFIVPWLFSIHSFRHYQLVCSQFNFNLSNCATATLYRKSVLDIIGGFDPDFWAGWEDFDLGYRISLSGFESVYTPNTTVFHVGSGSFKGNIPHESRLLRNRFFTLVKNYETKNLLVRFLPFVMISPILFVLRIILNETLLLLSFFKFGPLGNIYQISFQKCLKYRKKYAVFFMGYISFLRGLRRAVSKRGTVQRLRTIADKTIFSKTEKKSFL